jgi:hypothetical protein
MSGEKTTRAQLTREAAQALEAEIEAMLRLRRALAETLATTESERLKLQPFLYTIQRHLKTEHDRFEEAIQSLKNDCVRLHGLVARIEAMRSSSGDLDALQHARAQLAQVRSEAEAIVKVAHSRSHEIRALVEGMLSGMDAAVAGSHRARAELAHLKAQVESLYEDGRGPLRWVPDRVQQLLQSLRPCETTSQADVDRATREFDALFETASEMERKHQELLEIASRLKSAFAAVGFTLVRDSTKDHAMQLPIEAQHEKHSEGVARQADTFLGEGGNLRIVTTAQGAGRRGKVEADGKCGEAIEELVARSANLELVFSQVIQSDPGGNLTIVHSGSQSERKHWGHWERGQSGTTTKTQHRTK